MYLFVDTETTGKILDWKAKPSKSTLTNFPRIVQLAFIACNEKGQEYLRFSQLIRPDGFEIPAEATKIHGISTAQALEEGIELSKALSTFLAEVSKCKYLVAHNIAFDYPVLVSECIRANLKGSGEKITQICTMQSSINFCELPNQYGYSSYKYPKLEELHEKLFGYVFEGSHDALNDVVACKNSFFELVKLGIIKLE